MQAKSKHFKDKYTKSQHNKSFFFYYLKTSKAGLKSKLFYEINIKKCGILNLPSAFKLEKNIDLQGPSLVIIYSSYFNLKLLTYFSKFEANALKHCNVYYAPNLITDCSLYITSSILCLNFAFILSYKS